MRVKNPECTSLCAKLQHIQHIITQQKTSKINSVNHDYSSILLPFLLSSDKKQWFAVGIVFLLHHFLVVPVSKMYMTLKCAAFFSIIACLHCLISIGIAILLMGLF